MWGSKEVSRHRPGHTRATRGGSAAPHSAHSAGGSRFAEAQRGGPEKNNGAVQMGLFTPRDGSHHGEGLIDAVLLKNWENTF